MKNEIKFTLLVTVFTVMGGILGTLITSKYQNEVSKREVNTEIVKLLSNKLLKEQPVIMSKDMNIENINGMFQYKEKSFLIRQLTNHLKDNYDYLDFRALSAALSSVERRYSYAKIYEAAGAAKIICENLELAEFNNTIQVSQNINKCVASELDGLSIHLIQTDVKNYRFKLRLDSEEDNPVCNGRQCDIWVDLGERLESTAYEYLFLAEYVGMSDPYGDKEPVAAFSIVKRISNTIQPE